MSAGRKLPPEQEAALIAWYSQYQQALVALRELGSIREKAKQYGITKETVHLVVKREKYELRRKLKVAGITSIRVKIERASAVQNQNSLKEPVEG